MNSYTNAEPQDVFKRDAEPIAESQDLYKRDADNHNHDERD
ncbi:3573_t:CDS:1, partial [Rhizophagus irregularis]